MIHTLVARLHHEKFIVINTQELEQLLQETQEVVSADTCINGFIRILSHDDQWYFQEQDYDHRILLRAIVSLEQGQELLQKRLATYEKMWDGCGCKVDFNQ